MKLLVFVLAFLNCLLGLSQERDKSFFPFTEYEFMLGPNITYLFQRASYLDFDGNKIGEESIENNNGINIGVIGHRPLNTRKSLWFSTGLIISYKQMRTWSSWMKSNTITEPLDPFYGVDSLDIKFFHFRRKLDIEVPFLINLRTKIKRVEISPSLGIIPGKSIFSKIDREFEYFDYPGQAYHIISYKHTPDHFINRLNLFAGLGFMVDINDNWKVGIQPNVRFDIFPLIATANLTGFYSGDYVDEWVSYSINLSMIRKSKKN